MTSPEPVNSWWLVIVAVAAPLVIIAVIAALHLVSVH